MGGAGYLVNSSALRVALWHTLFSPEHIRGMLYEDMCVASVLLQAGGRVVGVPFADAIGADGEE
jgi:hypothetical protein